MRLWLLVGLAAALTLVAVARADPGDSTEVEDAVGEKEDRLRVRREDRKRKPPPSQPCPGCYSPLSKPTTPVRSRRQVEKQQQPRRRLRPESTWRSGSLIPIKKEVVQDSEVRTRREVERCPQPRPGPSPNPPGRSPYNYGYLTALAGSSGVRGPAPQGRGRRAIEGTQLRTLKPKQPRLPCSGCYSPLGFPKDNHQQERVKREGQKPQRARPTGKPTWNPGSGSILGMIHLEEFITLPTPVLHCPSCQGSVATGQDGRSGDPEPQDQERRRKAHGGEVQSQAESERLTLRCWLRFQPHTAGPDGPLERGGGQRIKGD